MLPHIFLHVALCGAVARAAPDASIAMRVRMAYPQGDPEIDKVVKFTRGYDAQTVVEFDVPRNTYRLQLDVPKYGCSVSDYIEVLADRNRTVTETLADGPPEPAKPSVLMSGGAPMSFLYLRPTFVIFDKGLACNAPISTPLPSSLDVEYDPGAYYVWLHLPPVDAAGAPGAPDIVALRLRTPTGLAHYVRLPIAFPVVWSGWPNSIHFEISEDMVDDLATEKTDTLLCPKIWSSAAH